MNELKKQSFYNSLIIRQALHIIFLKTQYKAYRRSSILYFNPLFSDVPSFSKISQPPSKNQHIVKSVFYHPCPLRLASRLTLTFIRHLILINSNLIKQKNSLLFRIKFKQFHTLANTYSKLYLHYMYITFFTVIILSIFVWIYCCELFFINVFLLTSSSDAQCIWCFTLCSCYMYRVLSHIIYAVTK